VQSVHFVQICLLSASLVAVPAMASAQAADTQALRQEIDQLKADIEMLRQQYAERLAALEARLAAPAAPAAAVPQAPPPSSDLQQAPAQPASSAAANAKVFNPDTSVIGNFIGVAGKNPQSEDPPLSLTEVEAAFQAVVDPYARADFFLSASPEGLEVEEGYITFTALPAGLLLKAGKMRAQFGKVNTMHTHILPWADRPLVLRNLLGGDEGVADAGFSVSKLIPNRFLFIDAIGEVYRGDSGVFHAEKRSELNYLGRLRGYRDLTEATNLDVGTSYFHGPSEAVPGSNAQRIGVDATFRYRPLRRAIYRQFVGRTELIWSREEAFPGLRHKASGFYSSGDFQFARRWFVGVRADRSGRPLDPDIHDSGGSISLTFKPSEFALVRGQYRRTQYGEGVTADEAMLQLNFSIGAHGAHPF
jgi:hypothetical protein